MSDHTALLEALGEIMCDFFDRECMPKAEAIGSAIAIIMERHNVETVAALQRERDQLYRANVDLAMRLAQPPPASRDELWRLAASAYKDGYGELPTSQQDYSDYTRSLVEVLRGAVEGGVCEDELKLISEHGQPHGIRDRSGYLFFFRKVGKYSGQEDRYRRELAQMFRLADYLLQALRATVTKSAAPFGKPCTCPDTSKTACGVERGSRLGELWYCRRQAEIAAAAEGRGVCVPGGEVREDPLAHVRWICENCTTVNSNDDTACVGCKDPRHGYPPGDGHG